MRKALSFAYLLLPILTGFLYAETIYSQPTGGFWGNEATWVGNIVPASTDNVVITGPVTADNRTCADLAIDAGGSLTNYNYSYTLTITGNLVNNGTLQNNPGGYLFNINLHGNLENNGVFSIYQLYFTGCNTQNVTMTQPVTSSYIYNDKTAGDVIAQSDLNFQNSSFDFNNHSLYMTAYNISIENALYVKEIDLHLDYNNLTMTSSGYIQNSSITDGHLYGVINFANNVDLYGDIFNYGDIRNHSGSSYSVNFHGTLINEGTLRNNPLGSYLTLYLYSDFNNFGNVDLYRIYLMGLDQHIGSEDGTPFAIDYFYGTSSDATLTFDTDISFINTDIDLNGCYLELQYGNTLDLDHCILSESVVTGNQATINSENTCRFEALTIDTIYLTGTTQIYGNNVTLMTSVINDGILQNFSNNSYTLNIDGDFINNGTIRNSPAGYYLNLNIAGNIENNGTWNIYNWYMTSSEQELSAPGGDPFTAYIFHGNTSGGSINFVGDISFINSQIDLNGNSLFLGNGDTLSLTNCQLYDGTIEADEAMIYCESNTRIKALNLYDAQLDGTTLISDGNVHFYGDLVNHGILRNLSNNSYAVWFHNNLINNGTIESSPLGYNLNINLYGDFENNGPIAPFNFYMQGSTDQHITCSNEGTLGITYFHGPAIPIDIYLDSSVQFINTTIDLNNCTFNMLNGSTLTLNGGHMMEGVIETNGANLSMSGNAYIQNLDLMDVNLDGIIQVADSNVDFMGDVVLNGTLQNFSWNTCEVDFFGDIINNGIIRNNPGGYWLYVNLFGDATQNGTWTNNRVDVKGNEEQWIVLQSGNPISGTVRFFSEILTGPFQWYVDNVGITSENPAFSGELTSILTWDVGMSDIRKGTYNCMTGEGLSRDIHVADTDTSEGLVAWYPFNGDALDYSGNYHNATPFGNPAEGIDRFGNAGGCYNFDGIDDYMTCGSWFTYDDFTLSFWVNQDQINYFYTAIIDNNHTDTVNWVVQFNESDGRYHLGTAPQGSAYFDLPFNEWTHVVCMKSGNVLSTYINGVMQDQLVASTDEINYVNPQLNIARWQPGGRYFDGDIDDIRMYNRALLEAEIMELYQEENPAPAAPSWLVIEEVDSGYLLNWQPVEGATSYNIYSDIDPEGEFTNFVQNAVDTSCFLPYNGERLFYVVRAVK